MHEQEIHLRDYLRVILKRRTLVANFFVVTVVLVLIGTFAATPRYEATTQLLIEKNEANPMAKGMGYPAFDPEFLETQYQIIKSFNVSRKVVSLLALDTKYPQYFGGGEKGGLPGVGALFGWLRDLRRQADLKRLGVAQDPDTMTRADEIAKGIAREIVVKPVRNTRIVTVSFMAENPVLAKMVVNSVARAYMDEVLAIKMHSAEYALKWMSNKAGEELTKLEASEKALQQYMKENDIVTVENRVALVPEKLAEFGSQLSKTEARRKELETIMARIREVGSKRPADLEAQPLIAADRALQALREQMVKQEQQIAELGSKYGEKHPMMIRAQSELEALRDKKDQEIRRIVEGLRTEYELVRANEANLHGLVQQAKGETLNLGERFIQYNILKREVETNRAVHEALMKEIKSQNLTEQTQTVNVWVVEPAKTPESPAKPKKALNLALGLLVGLFGGIGLAFFVEYLDNTVKSPEETERRLGVTVLGVVEQLKEADAAGGTIDSVLQTAPMSRFAECFKTIRSAVLLSAADQPPKSIMITSMAPQEGKTTVAMHLAATIAQAGHKVIVVDADLRKPTLHKRLGLPNTTGLSSYLAGATGRDVVLDHPAGQIKVITSGPVPPNPSELLGSARMRELVAKLEDHFDFVIIDSAPIMGASDGLVVSKLVRGSLVVARAGVTPYEVLERGLKSLRDIDALVLGMVINGVDFEKDRYHSYYYGYYSYYSSNAEG
ncbi:MAG: polysaccharide biosynthesis tyrosine autokinase [Thermodesulfobacteriota bacterium]